MRFFQSLCQNLFLWFLTSLSVMSLPALAQDVAPLPGAEDPAFQAALESWLAGEDLAALTALADLSGSENRAAQIFLARLDRLSHLHRHATASLERKARVTLMRQPGGLSGKSWMEAAAVDVPLAQAFQDIGVMEKKAEGLRSLFALGEPYAASNALPGYMASGAFEDVIDIIATAPNAPAATRDLYVESILALKSGGTAYQGSARLPHMLWTGTAKEVDGLPQVAPTDRIVWAPPHPGRWREGPETEVLMKTYAPKVPAWQPIVRFCESACAGEVETCVAVAAGQLSGAPMPFQSPLETVLSSEDYQKSPRFEYDFARVFDTAFWHVDQVRAYSSCLSDALQAQIDLSRKS
ncbi:hypothetical protein [Celeribacter sp.]|uniref:hypothetical protein n=1 Tax=Celeribacter sp. TaxID=1890673 RepID=UPI003A901F47